MAMRRQTALRSPSPTAPEAALTQAQIDPAGLDARGSSSGKCEIEATRQCDPPARKAGGLYPNTASQPICIDCLQNDLPVGLTNWYDACATEVKNVQYFRGFVESHVSSDKKDNAGKPDSVY